MLEEELTQVALAGRHREFAVGILGHRDRSGGHARVRID